MKNRGMAGVAVADPKDALATTANPAGMAFVSFCAYGLGKFDTSLLSVAPGRVTRNGSDESYGAGARVGWMGKFLDGRLALGATYATRIYLLPLTKYKGLFADGGDFDLPRNFAVGIAVKPIRRLAVGLDVQRVFYREVHSVGDRHPVGSGPSIASIKKAVSAW